MLNDTIITDTSNDTRLTDVDFNALLNAAEPKVGFSQRQDGLYFGEKKEGIITEARVCGPIEVVAMTRDEEGLWGTLVRFSDLDKKPVEKVIPLRMFEGDGKELREMLRDSGLGIEPTQDAKRLLKLFIETTTPTVRVRVVRRIGWYGNTFILPEASFGPMTDRIICEVGSHAYYVAGTTEEWQQQIGKMCVGNSRLVLAVSTAFASPLLRRAGAESGGFHVRGPSSTGKSTALDVGGSVWGGPKVAGCEKGFVGSWRNTTNGLEGVAVAHNDALLCLDEMSQVAAGEVGESAYMLANGKGKGRMNRDSTMREIQTWSILFLSSGEIALSAHMREGGKRVRGGQETRLVDIPADAGAGMGLFENLHGFASGGEFSEHLKAMSRQYYGAAIRDMIQHVIDGQPDVPKLIEAEKTAILKGIEGCAEIGRVAGRFALVAAAGELATAYGITGWPEGEARKAARTCFQSWLRERGHGAADEQAVVTQIRQFIQQRGSRFVAVDQYGSTISDSRVGFRQDRGGVTEYCCFAETFKAILCEGYDPKMAARALHARGYLVTDGSRVMVKRKVPDSKENPRMYVIKGSILEGDAEAL